MPELAPALEPLPECPDPPKFPELGLPEAAAPEGAPLELADELPAVEVPDELPAVEVPDELPAVEVPDELPAVEVPDELPESAPVPASSVPGTNALLLQPLAGTSAKEMSVQAHRRETMRFMRRPPARFRL
ncbi:MAG TPA: hypothetical protein VGY54_26505 [Polyangiaceae bacterium]|jgi:hypothetical protein|nr:hypothetical protein [Polyangiaceae bacterium]